MNRIYSAEPLIELKDLLQKVLDSEVPRLGDLRRIEQLRRGIQHSEDAGFFVIRAAVSDLDAVPDESRRGMFAKEFLAEKDEEFISYMQDAAHDLRASAAALLSSEWMSI
ncbi:hypothetical protein P3W24_18360 [Luteibacter sp. PPL201]|uniref:Uncharacterized protein n=1 Tax=Luteibacter sahnii TaxID=3021977 RepID=A0ABT6BFW8_9GAMM